MKRLPMTYNIVPCPKPRMTRSDKWKKRPATDKYWSFCEQCRLLKMDFQSGDSILFMIPMPESWGLKKKHAMVKQPHKSKPDLDNLIKAVGDALYDDDSGLWNYRAAKRWGYEGQIIITPQL